MNEKYAGRFHKNLKMESQIKEEMDNYIKQKDKCKTMPKMANQNKTQPNEGSNQDNRLKAYFKLTKPTFDSNQKTKAETHFMDKNYNNTLKEETKNQKGDGPNKYLTMRKSDGLTFSIVEEKVNMDDIDLNKQFDIDEKSLIEQYDVYFEEKFKPLEKVSKNVQKEKLIVNEKTKKPIPKMEPLFNVHNSYLLGGNVISNSIPKNNLFCYHKEDKWVAYLNHNLIIIENFHSDEKRDQLILLDHKINSSLDSIKLSNGGRILYAAANKQKGKNSVIVFYSYRKNTFDYINKFTLPSEAFINDYSISPLNNMCIILYNKNCISCVDFGAGEELISVSSVDRNNTFLNLKWNNYISELEFCTVNSKNFSVWKLNSQELTMKEKTSKLNFFCDKRNKNESIISFGYTPPVSIKCVICVLFALTNGTIMLVDYNEDKILKQYSSYDLFQLNSILFFDVDISMYFISFIYDKKVKYYRLPILSQVEYSDIELFKNPLGEIEHDSDVISIDINENNPKGEGISMTKKGGLFYINYQEECTVRLYNFIPDESNKIKQCILLNKNIKQISLQNLLNTQIKENYDKKTFDTNGYYLITSHEGGNVKIWNIPEYNLEYSFEVKDEIELMKCPPNDLKILVFYRSGNIRSFDIVAGKASSKINISSILGDNNNFKICTFYPDGKYFIGVDNKQNHIYLSTIDSYDPLSIHFNQILNKIRDNIIDIGLHLLDSYNFLYINNNKEINVYSRQFTNLIQDLSFEKSVPQYGKIDTFDPFSFCKSNSLDIIFDNCKQAEEEVVYLQSSFSPISYEKDFILILSKKHNIVILRDYKMRIVTKITKFDDNLLSFQISSLGEYILYLFPTKIKFTQFNKPDESKPLKGNILSLKINNKKNSFPNLSQDNKMILLHDTYMINFFEIVEHKK